MIIYLKQNNGNVGEEGEFYYSSSLVNRYHTIAVRTFLKLMIKIENIKMMQIPGLDIWSMLFAGLVLHRIDSSHLFWNFKDPMLV